MVVDPAVFLAVRTVGRDADKVVQDGAARAASEFIQVRMRTGESAGFRQVASDDLRGHGEDFRVAGDFDCGVAEAVVGEARMPGLRAAAFENVTFGLKLAALDETRNVVEMQRAVRVENIAVLDSDFASADAADGEFRASGDVDSGVQEPGPDLFHGKKFADAAGRSGLFEKQSAGSGCDDGAVPCGIVESVFRPSGKFKAGVVVLSVAQAVEGDGTVR